MEGWNEYRLEEIGEIVGGSTPSTKDPKNYDGDISWITPKDLSNFNGRYISKGERMISSNGLKNSSCKMLPKGSILFSSRAPIGYIAIASNNLCTNQGFKSIIPDCKIVDNIFLYYLLVFNKNKIESLGSGTTFKEVSGKTMKNVCVKIPSLTEQKEIANILSSIDDKIENNRKINENLEQQAQALFKSWFVDFEPFRDQPFVESELGMIPQGWKVCSLKDVCESITDGVHNSVSDDKNGSYYLLSCKNIKGGELSISNNDRRINEETFNKLRKRTRLNKGDILLSSVGTIGELLLLNENPINYEFQRSVAILKPNIEKLSSIFLFFSLKNQKNRIINAAHGAVQQCLFISDISKLLTIYPPCDEIVNFTSIVSPLIKQITYNQIESRKLAKLRDTLLPKLMSGEIKV